MGKPKAPQAPDPKDTAAASTGTNVSTAVANSYLNNFDQVTPDGTLSYETIGYETMTDPYTGQSYKIPKRRATQQLSEAQQGIYDTNQTTQQNIANIGAEQSGRIQGLLGTPLDLSNEATEARLYELGSKRLDPRFAQEEDALRTRLINQGIREGTPAYKAEMARMGEGKNDAYNQLLLTGRGQAVQEALTERNAPINEITALLSGSQVSMPNFVNPTNSSIPTTDTAGIINQDYSNRMGSYNQQMGQWNSTMGGLLGFGGQLIGLSDDRAKKGKKRLGDAKGKMGLWQFNYKGEPRGTPKHVGLMASEVQKERPDAVIKRPDGMRMVNSTEALGLAGL
jgi:hypothetical protein